MQSLVAAAEATLQEMAGTSVAVRSGLPSEPRGVQADVAVVLGIVSAAEGRVIIEFPRTASALARRVLEGLTDERDDAMIRDCLGEIANVIAGQTKALVACTPHRFTFALPRVVVGSSTEVTAQEGEQSTSVVIATDVGEFAMHLVLKRATSA
jgi:chemotaxis protein CheX